MEPETTSRLKKISQYAGGVTAILALVFGVWKIDDRYAKQTSIIEVLNSNKLAIIAETRREIVKNRAAMIATMERAVDDLGYDILSMEKNNIPVPRYIIEKRKQLRRDINTLREQ